MLRTIKKFGLILNFLLLIAPKTYGSLDQLCFNLFASAGDTEISADLVSSYYRQLLLLSLEEPQLISVANALLKGPDVFESPNSIALTSNTFANGLSQLKELAQSAGISIETLDPIIRKELEALLNNQMVQSSQMDQRQRDFVRKLYPIPPNAHQILKEYRPHSVIKIDSNLLVSATHGQTGGGVKLWDMKDLSNPKYLLGLNQSFPGAIAANSQYVFVANDNVISVHELGAIQKSPSNIHNPLFSISLPVPNTNSSIASKIPKMKISNELLYVAHYESSQIFVYDLQGFSTQSKPQSRLSSVDSQELADWSRKFRPDDFSVNEKYLAISDYVRHRVLLWKLPLLDPSQLPDIVLGQPDLLSTDSSKKGNGLKFPSSVALIGDKLFVADSENKMLIWDKVPERSNQKWDHEIPLHTLFTPPPGFLKNEPKIVDLGEWIGVYSGSFGSLHLLPKKDYFEDP